MSCGTIRLGRRIWDRAFQMLALNRVRDHEGIDVRPTGQGSSPAMWDLRDSDSESVRWTRVQLIHVDVPAAVGGIDGKRRQPQLLPLLQPAQRPHEWSELVELPSEVVSAPLIAIACDAHGKTVEAAVDTNCMDPADPYRGTHWSQSLRREIRVL